MKVVIFGLGSIGLRYAVLLRNFKNVELYAFRTYKNADRNTLGIKEIETWRTIDQLKPAIAFITNPTSLHVPTAIRCAQRGMHLFIEKPLGNTTRHLRKLLRLISQKKLSTYVAYVLRFHPIIQELARQLRKDKPLHVRVTASSYLPSWRPPPGGNHAYSMLKNMGGGVILDLSHELDYIDYLFGGIRKLKGRYNRRSRITIDSEDYADILIETQTVPVNLHLNYFGQKFERKICVDFSSKTLEADLVKSTIGEYKGNRLIRSQKYDFRLQDAYVRQLKYFFKHLNDMCMMNNAVDASVLFRKICIFKQKNS